jgi:hypothetical protein
MKRTIEISRHHRHTSSVSSLGSISSEIDWIIQQDEHQSRQPTLRPMPTVAEPSIWNYSPALLHHGGADTFSERSSSDSDPHSPYYRRRRIISASCDVSAPPVLSTHKDAEKLKAAPSLPILEPRQSSMTSMVTVLARSSPEINALCESFGHVQSPTNLVDLARLSFFGPLQQPPPPAEERDNANMFRTPPTKRPLFGAVTSPPSNTSRNHRTALPQARDVARVPRDSVPRIPSRICFVPKVGDEDLGDQDVEGVGLLEQKSPATSDDSAAILSADLDRVKLRDDDDPLHSDMQCPILVHPRIEGPSYWESPRSGNRADQPASDTYSFFPTRKVTDCQSESSNAGRITPLGSFSNPSVASPVISPVPVLRTEVLSRRRSSAPSRNGKQARLRKTKKGESLRLRRTQDPTNRPDISSRPAGGVEDLVARPGRIHERTVSDPEHGRPLKTSPSVIASTRPHHRRSHCLVLASTEFSHSFPAV